MIYIYSRSFKSTEKLELDFCESITWNPINCSIFAISHTGELYEIEPITCNLKFIGSTGTNDLVSISYNSIDGKLYSISSSMLYEINMTTGKATSIGPLDTGTLMYGIDCDKDGVMYGFDLNFGNSALWSIDLDTGSATKIGLTGVPFSYGMDMAYDRQDGIMYAITKDYSAWSPEINYVNLTSGKFTKISPCDSINCFCIPYDCGNQPPSAPTIQGPSGGTVGRRYEYKLTVEDPDGDNVSYYIEWGDGTSDGWTDYQKSGVPISLDHAWNTPDYFEIRCKAKDVYGAEGNWSEVDILISKNKATYNSFFLQFLERFPLLREVLALVINY